MKRYLIVPLFVVAFAALPASAGDEFKLDNENSRINYSVGYQVGNDLRRQHIEIDPEIVARGIADALSGKEPALSSLEMHKELTDLQRRVSEARKAGAQEKNETPSQ